MVPKLPPNSAILSATGGLMQPCVLARRWRRVSHAIQRRAVIALALLLGLTGGCGQTPQLIRAENRDTSVPSSFATRSSAASPQQGTNSFTNTHGLLAPSGESLKGGDTRPGYGGINGEVPLSTKGELLATPSEVMGPTSEQELMVEQARHAIIAKCMKEKGFDYSEPVPVLSSIRKTSMPVLFAELGLLNREYGETNGYQWYRPDMYRVKGETQPTPAFDPSLGLPQGYEEALRGDETKGEHGCENQAHAVIDADSASIADAESAIMQIDGAGFDGIYGDNGYISAMKEWSTCMKGRGYHYKDPTAAYDAFDGFQYDPRDIPPHPSDAEIATAMADLDCKDKTNLVERYRSVLWKHWSALIKENRPAQEKLKVYWEEQTRKAADIIANNS